MRVALIGAGGRMGRAIASVIAEAPDAEVVAAFGAAGEEGALPGGVALRPLEGAVEADVAIEFSSPAGTIAAARACLASEVPLVSGTTGLDADALAALDALAESVPCVWAPNMSVGVTLLFHLAEQATRLAGEGFDAEIVEMHHRHKVDAPSGTAVRLAERVAAARSVALDDVVTHGRSGQVGARPAGEIGVMTLRGGSVVGEHTLVLAGEGERIELTHRAGDRSIFARGAVRAARWVVGRVPGRYDMGDVLGIT